MTEVLALQQLELETEQAAEAYPWPCFSIYASTWLDPE
ncbi:class III lanthipeptide [Kitasatospora sp. NPDC049285]